MLPRLCFPNPPHGAELWGAESLQSPTLTGPPARGSSNALLLHRSILLPLVSLQTELDSTQSYNHYLLNMTLHATLLISN